MCVPALHSIQEGGCVRVCMGVCVGVGVCVFPYNRGLKLALHELDFFLYFSLENSILSCVTVDLQHILQHLKNCHFHIL